MRYLLYEVVDMMSAKSISICLPYVSLPYGLFRQPVGVGELGTSSTAVGRYVTELLGTVSSSFSIITSCAPTAPQIRFFLYRNKT